ncbi:MAG: hypothetical protein R3A48_07845 [Polyangiales bacterium]
MNTARRSSPMTFPLPEAREMVAAARRYVIGEVHFSELVGPTERCEFWARVYGVHPALHALAAEWQRLLDQTWNERGQHPVALPERELRRRIASHLGISLADPTERADGAASGSPADSSR